MVYPTESARSLLRKNIVREQKADEKCKKIRQLLATQLPPEKHQDRKKVGQVHKWFVDQEGLLARRRKPIALAGESEEDVKSARDKVSRRDRALARTAPESRIVVPKALINDVLWVFHGLPVTGHMGRNKTLDLIAMHFWWKGMSGDVRRRVRGCHACQMRKAPRPTKHMKPGELVANEPWELVSIDVVGPLPEASGEVKLLTVVDVFSRYPLAIPIPNEKAETVARMLHRYLFSVHGYPKLILSDRAKGFVSKGLQWLYGHLGIARVLTTGRLPTGNSSVERTHRGYNAALTIVCNRAKNDWDVQIDAVLFAARVSICESTGHSPYYLVHGRHPRLPIEVLTGLQEATAKKHKYEFVERMVGALQSAFELSLIHI